MGVLAPEWYHYGLFRPESKPRAYARNYREAKSRPMNAIYRAMLVLTILALSSRSLNALGAPETPELSLKTFRDLQRGMPREEVEAILGPPTKSWVDEELVEQVAEWKGKDCRALIRFGAIMEHPAKSGTLFQNEGGEVALRDNPTVALPEKSTVPTHPQATVKSQIQSRSLFYSVRGIALALLLAVLICAHVSVIWIRIRWSMMRPGICWVAVLLLLLSTYAGVGVWVWTDLERQKALEQLRQQHPLLHSSWKVTKIEKISPMDRTMLEMLFDDMLLTFFEMSDVVHDPFQDMFKDLFAKSSFGDAHPTTEPVDRSQLDLIAPAEESEKDGRINLVRPLTVFPPGRICTFSDDGRLLFGETESNVHLNWFLSDVHRGPDGGLRMVNYHELNIVFNPSLSTAPHVFKVEETSADTLRFRQDIPENGVKVRFRFHLERRTRIWVNGNSLPLYKMLLVVPFFAAYAIWLLPFHACRSRLRAMFVSSVAMTLLGLPLILITVIGGLSHPRMSVIPDARAVSTDAILAGLATAGACACGGLLIGLLYSRRRTNSSAFSDPLANDATRDRL
jgi:hypothetical protein